MRTTFIVITLMTALASPLSFADSLYDYRTGNSYNRNTDSLGNTNVRGNNYRTGSSWNTQVDRDGDMRGTDSGGNSWNYNRGTKTYMNYGTGKTCTGSGYGRVCSGGD